MAKHVSIQFSGMRKPQRFILYPYDGGETLLIQSDTRIGRVTLRTGKTLLSAPRQGGAYGVHLSMPSAKVVDMPAEALTEIQGYLWHNEGKEGNIGGVITYEVKELFSTPQK